jgi:hypothetical protein
LNLIRCLLTSTANVVPNKITNAEEDIVQIIVQLKTLKIDLAIPTFLKAHHLPYCDNPTHLTILPGGSWLNPILVNEINNDVIIGVITINIIKNQPGIDIIHGNPDVFNHLLVCVHVEGLEPSSIALPTLYAEILDVIK